jgi:hypothetical protein
MCDALPIHHILPDPKPGETASEYLARLRAVQDERIRSGASREQLTWVLESVELSRLPASRDQS